MHILFSWLKEFLELSLPPQALAERLTLGGAEVTNVTPLEKDWLFEMEITPNRPDLLSHLGIARETAALLGRHFRFPRWLKRQIVIPEGESPQISVLMEDSEGCRRYIGIVIEKVHVRPSPPEFAQRLTQVGFRPVNNVVDATNLCLLELGQPLHAFDLDRLEGRRLHVRRAQSAEKLVTLDGVSRSLTSEALVIADGHRPVALAGVMGGRDTEVHSGTRTIFLESAWFEPTLIRRASQQVGLSSESSYRFERGVDPEMVPFAAARAARLICQLAEGKIKGAAIDVGQPEMPRRSIPLHPRHAQAVLGMQIYPSQQKRLLERLGCQVTGTARNWHVTPPSWRLDLKISEDLYEELARLWGYDRCPETLPPRARIEIHSDWKPPEDPWIIKESQIRQLLLAAGFQEILTYSLINPEDHARIRFLAGNPLALENPLSMEQAVLRTSLLVGALQTVARNLHWKTSASFQLFELGHVYGEDEKRQPTEEQRLSLLVAGTPEPEWGIQRESLGLFHLKGIIQFLGERLHLDLTPEPAEISQIYSSGKGVRFKRGGKILGAMGIVEPTICAAYEIPMEIQVAYGEFDLEQLSQIQPTPLQVRPLLKVPPVVRDLAIVVAEDVPHEELQTAIQKAGGALLKKVTLFDLYRGKQVPPGMKSLAFRLSFSEGDKTLTDEEVNASHQKIRDSLKESFGATLR